MHIRSSPTKSESNSYQSSSPTHKYDAKSLSYSFPSVAGPSPDKTRNHNLTLSTGNQIKHSDKQNSDKPNTNSFLSNPLRTIVSKNKKRFLWQKYDLDLAYITNSIIAMGFPSENIEAIYRNSLQEVKGFLEQRHKNHYRVYNLCSERRYSSDKFSGNVAQFPFDDHNAPPFQLIYSCCEDLKQWLQKDKNNVAAIHCKAGKGRTGLIICCYLLFCDLATNSEQSLQHYGEARTMDGKGVTIQSQRRYISYFQQAMKANLTLQKYLSIKKKLKIKSIKVTSCPQIHLFGGCTPWILLRTKSESYKSKYSHQLSTYSAGQQFQIQPEHPFDLTSDFKITFYSKGKFLNKSQEFMALWLNVKFINKQVIQISAQEIDGIKSKDQRFNMKMKVIISFSSSQ